MTAGTIALTNGSKVVTGTGTAFTTDTAAADFIIVTVGGTTYSLAVDSVTDDTHLKLVLDFDGPTDTGIAWTNVPYGAQMRLSQQMGNDMSRLMRFYLTDKSNWQKILTGPGEVTIKFPDGSEETGLSWPALIAAVGDAYQIKGEIAAGVDLNTLGPDSIGLWVQPVDVNAVSSLNYPEANKGGTLEIIPTRQGVIHRYTTQGMNTYTRSPSAQWNGTNGPFVPWVITSRAGGTDISAADVKFTPPWAGTSPLSAAAIFGERVSVKFFGAKGDGVTDDSAAFQAALDSGVRCIHVPAVSDRYVIKKQLNIKKGVNLVGDGVTPYTKLGSPNTRGPGSWLHFDHPGKGLFINSADGFSGVGIYSIGTMRTHPTPGAGSFTPNVYDWDIEVNNTVDVVVVDVCLLNPYKGITSYGSQTRMTVDRLYGHPLNQGMLIQEAFDIHRINNVHFWCFWAQNQQVWNYTLANLTAFALGRCDNHMYMNVFSIFHNKGIMIVASASGTANKLKLSNVDLDRGYHGYYIDSSAVGHTAQISNMTIQGETGVTGDNYGIAIYANQCDLSFSNLDIRNINSNAVYAAGTYTNIGVSEFYCSDWANAHTADPAINLVQPNSIMHINGSKRYYSTKNTALRYGGQGKVRTLIDRGTFSGTTNTSGDLTVPFTGDAIPTSVAITNYNAASLAYAITARNQNNFVVRVYSGTTPLTSTAIAFGWEVSI